MQRVWFDRTFDELTPLQLYRIVELRERVFVVEQACIYLDADGLDLQARHLWAESDERSATAALPGEAAPPNGGAVLIDAYLRIVPAGVKFEELSIGRVIVAPHARGTGLGKELMQRGIAAARGVPIRIGAQAHLEKFYAELGFARASEDFVEDGIPHLEMLRR
ncbi:MAG TPA: GNAT family N-acetyltransferase [Kofleriaceae bacterium]